MESQDEMLRLLYGHWSRTIVQPVFRRKCAEVHLPHGRRKCMLRRAGDCVGDRRCVDPLGSRWDRPARRYLSAGGQRNAEAAGPRRGRKALLPSPGVCPWDSWGRSEPGHRCHRSKLGSGVGPFGAPGPRVHTPRSCFDRPRVAGLGALASRTSLSSFICGQKERLPESHGPSLGYHAGNGGVHLRSHSGLLCDTCVRYRPQQPTRDPCNLRDLRSRPGCGYLGLLIHSGNTRQSRQVRAAVAREITAAGSLGGADTPWCCRCPVEGSLDGRCVK